MHTTTITSYVLVSLERKFLVNKTGSVTRILRAEILAPDKFLENLRS
jgi:hypothetical protein